jgi:hypothetical protein
VELIAPTWLPTSKVKPSNITPVAWFAYDFEAIASKYQARISLDRKGGGAGPVRHFFLQLGSGRLAEFNAWEHKPGIIELSLEVGDDHIVHWEDFDAAMSGLGVALERVMRQGAFSWERSKPQ